MKPIHLLFFFGTLICVWATYNIPLKRHQHNPVIDTAVVDIIAELEGSIPFRYGSIPVHRRLSDVMPLVNYLSTQYYGELQIGTPAQTLRICFDTGSSDMFVLAPNCTGLACWGRTVYNYTDSTSFIMNGSEIVLPFGSGNFTGFLGADDITVGDYPIKDMLFSLIYYPDSPSFLYARFDGLAGLAYPDLAIKKLPCLFQTMLDQGLITDPSFSFYLTKEPSQNGSAMIFGGVDMKYAASNFTYIKLTRETYYMIDLDDLKVGNKSFLTGSMNAIIDTGTSAIVGPVEVFEDIIAQFPSKINCSEVDSFDSLYFNFGGVDYEIPPSIYIVENFGHCALGIVAAEFEAALNNTVVVGDVFLRQYYTHFDYGNGRVGFAKAANVTDDMDIIYS